MVYCLGEALIDMLPDDFDMSKKYCCYAGGSIANVACCLALLGSRVRLISKVGNDIHGKFLIDVINKYGVDTSKVFFSKDKKTGVVYFSKNFDEIAAERENSADRYLYEQEINPEWFSNNDILHFSSVCLVDKPVRYAQKKAVESVIKANGRLSFDINYRPKIWPSRKDFLSQIWEFISYTDYLKLSEFDFREIAGEDYELGVKKIFEKSKKLKIIILTKASKGAEAFLRDSSRIHIDAFEVQTVDTLGAGDCFMGCFLHFIDKINPQQNQLKDILTFCSAAAALSVTKKGAIDSLPNFNMVTTFLKNKGIVLKNI